MNTMLVRVRATALSALAAAFTALPARAELPAVQAHAVEAAPALGVSGLAQAGLGMLMVLGLIFLCAWLARRFGLQRLGGNHLVKVVSSASIGQREKIVVVELDGTWLVLGVTPSQVSTLHSLPAQPVPQAPALKALNALDTLRMVRSRRTAAPAQAPAATPFDPVSQFAQKLHESLTGKGTLARP